MSGFIEGDDRRQVTLFPESLDDYIAENSPVRVIDVFIDELDISGLGFKTVAEITGRPAIILPRYSSFTFTVISTVSSHQVILPFLTEFKSRGSCCQS